MKKIITIVGARPQFVKHFPLEIRLKEYFDVCSVHTGQHYDESMSQVFFDELNISKPKYTLSLTKHTHAGQTGEMLAEIEAICFVEKPDAMIVYGDTNSTLAGALVASKLGIPIVHVEAGLRSRNMQMPEEVNRILTDHVSSVLICSSDIGINNLANEGITGKAHISGDLMKDALRLLEQTLKPEEKDYYFATLHRPYNTDNFARLSYVLKSLAGMDAKVILPVHPRTRKILDMNEFDYNGHSNISFIQPIGYYKSLSYQKFSKAVITDSGGIQKEAYWLKRKCITIRTETEWLETIEGAWNTLVFESLDQLPVLVTEQPDESKYDPFLYGDGYSAEYIVKLLQKVL